MNACGAAPVPPSPPSIADEVGRVLGPRRWTCSAMLVQEPEVADGRLDADRAARWLADARRPEVEQLESVLAERRDGGWG